MSATKIAVRRKATLGICGTCHVPVLGGLDGETCSHFAIVDISSLNNSGIVNAILEKANTYDLIHGNLWIREIAHYGKPLRYAVLREHRCARAIAADERVPIAAVAAPNDEESPTW